MAQATLSCRYAAIHLVYHSFYTVSPFRVGRGDLTPPQTQIVGETVVSRQSKSAAPEGVALVVYGGRESARKTPRGAALRKSGKTGATAICSGKCA